MTRLYIQPSFLNSCEDHGVWSGGNDQYRGDKSVDLSTFDKNGRARVGAFTDEAIESLKKKPKKTAPIADKILPQRKRVLTLTQQMVDLVQEYKSGKMTIEEYTLLLSVVSARRDRAIQLLAKAKSVRAPFETFEDEAESNENKPNCLGKTHVKSEKSFKTSKRIATEGNRFKDTEKPTISCDRSKLSKALDWIGKNDWFVFCSASTIVFTAAKIIF